MDINNLSNKDIKEGYKRSRQIFFQINNFKFTLGHLNSAAEKELDNLRESIVQEELQNRDNPANKDELFEKTDITLRSDTTNNQEAVLLEQYLNQYYQDDLKLIKSDMISEEFRDIESNSPNSMQLSNIVWRLTSKNKKQSILNEMEKVIEFNNTYSKVQDLIENVLSPVLDMNRNKLLKNFKQNEDDYYNGIEQIHNVEKSNVTHEEYKKIKKSVSNQNKFSDLMKELYSKDMVAHEEVKNMIYESGADQIQKELEETTLADFKQLYPDSNLRLPLLAQEGIKNVAQMNEYSSFVTIPGVGEVTNQFLENALLHYKSEVSKSIAFQFDAENKPKLHREIIRKLYVFVNDKELSKTIEQWKSEYQKMSFNQLTNDIDIRSEWALQQLSKNEALYDDYKLKLNKMEEYIKKYNPLVRQYFRANEKTDKFTSKELWSNFNNNAADYYAILDRKFDVGTSNMDNIIQQSGLSEEIIQKVKDYELNDLNLNATLRSWQEFGTKYALLQRKTLIGDEMGLGKTLISIASMVHLTYEEDKKLHLVICPASIMENWEREIKKFSDLKVYRTHGKYRDELLTEWKRTGGVAITTYETSMVLDFDDLKSIDMLTIDEAHYVKNPGAKRTRNARELTKKSDYALYLTGTPLENKVSEMTQVIKPLSPEIAQKIRKPKMTINSIDYRREIAPVYLRRTKKDVALELPPLSQIEEWEEFGKEEFEEYKDAVLNNKFMRMRRAAWVGGSRSESPKLNRLVELVDEAYENDSKVIVFTFFKDVIETVIDELGDRAVDPIHGGVSINSRQEIIDEFRESETKNVLVTQINTAAHGLNIQFANTIIFCEPQIKPSLETQAVARAYRMGQTDNVFVYRLLTINSIDELMMEMLDSKQALFDEFADRSHIMDKMKNIAEEDIETESTIQSKIIEHESSRLGIPVE